MSTINKPANAKSQKVSKRDAKRREIAESAVDALKVYGYARTTLRDIAAHSGMSLGSLHYYFEDKVDLMVYCVRQYKLQFVDVMRAAITEVEGQDQVLDAFCAGLAKTIVEHAELHRLWYDIRNQAMFDPVFSPVVAEIEGWLIDLMSPLKTEGSDTESIYLRLDGAFRYVLQRNLAGETLAMSDIIDILNRAATDQSTPR